MNRGLRMSYRGQAAQFVFTAAALDRGFDVFVPAGDYPGVDVIVRVGRKTTLVQVKRPQHDLRRRSLIRIDLRRSVRNRMRSRRRYKRSSFDILAVIYDGRWYFYRASKVFSKAVVYLNPDSKGSPPPDNWAIFL